MKLLFLGIWEEAGKMAVLHDRHGTRPDPLALEEPP